MDVSFDEIRKHVPVLAVDGIVMDGGKVLLIRRAGEPCRGFWALPGGFVELGEALEEAVAREVREETGLCAKAGRIAGVYSKPGRDPRGHIVSVVYLMEDARGKPVRTAEAKEIRFFGFDSLPEKMAFDHREIIGDAMEILRRGNQGMREG